MLAAAKAEVTRLTGALDTSNGQVTTLTTDLSTAHNKVTELEGQIGTATDPDSLQGMLEAEKLKVIRLESRVDTLSDTITGLRNQLVDARADVTEAEQRVQQADREADRRIEEAEQQTNVALRAPKWLVKFNDLTDLDTDDATVSVTHGRSPKVAPSGTFSRKSAAPSIPGFRGDVLSRPRGSVTDTVYLYTDITAPPNRAFWKVYGESVGWDPMDNKAKPTSGLPRATRSLLDPDGDGNDTPAEDRPAKRSLGGSYDGVNGKFECTGDSCNVLRAADDTLTRDGNWTFMPGSLTAGVSQDEDLSYLYFGIWSSEPDDPSAATYDFKWIAGG